jgi:NADH:ubiquinone oxidoreductase subunit 6 (subunit J)
MQPPPISVQTLGTELLGRHTASVLVIGILLTVALLGAIVIAAQDSKKDAS